MSACDLTPVSQQPVAPPLAVSTDIFPSPESRHDKLRVRRLKHGARVTGQELWRTRVLEPGTINLYDPRYRATSELSLKPRAH